MTSLGDYLKAAASLPWAWGSHDCSAWPARWASVPLPAYSTEAEAFALINDAGSLVDLWEHCGEGLLAPVETPEPGDIGILELVGFSRGVELLQIGGIFTGKRWAFVPSSGGVAAASADAIRVWRPLCRNS